MSRERPSRNRFAEVVLAALKVPCSHANCPVTLKFSEIKEHEASACRFRGVTCKWEPLGCTWAGLFHQQKEHHKGCLVRKSEPKDLLTNVRARDAKKDLEKQEREEAFKAQTQVCQLLATRCRDLVFRDIVLEKDPLSEEMCSKTFTAMGLALEIILDKSDSARLGLVLRRVNHIKHKIPLQVVVLGGPALLLALRPSVHHVVLRKRSRKTDILPLPLTPPQRGQVENMESINLRVGIADCSPGPVARSFTSVNETRRPSEDTESTSRSDEDEEDVFYSSGSMSDRERERDRDRDRDRDHDHDHGEDLSYSDVPEIY